MSGVRVLVGTRKGAFILTSDERRQEWAVSGPHFPGWEIYHVAGSPVLRVRGGPVARVAGRCIAGCGGRRDGAVPDRRSDGRRLAACEDLAQLTQPDEGMLG